MGRMPRRSQQPVDLGRLLGRALFKALHTDEASFAIMDLAPGTAGCTWAYGGCALLADALVDWAGPSAHRAMIVSGHGFVVQHAVTRIGSLYYDRDGVASRRTLMERFARHEHTRGLLLVEDEASYSAWLKEREAKGYMHTREQASKLADLLRLRLGPPQTWGVGTRSNPWPGGYAKSIAQAALSVDRMRTSARRSAGYIEGKKHAADWFVQDDFRHTGDSAEWEDDIRQITERRWGRRATDEHYIGVMLAFLDFVAAMDTSYSWYTYETNTVNVVLRSIAYWSEEEMEGGGQYESLTAGIFGVGTKRDAFVGHQCIGPSHTWSDIKGVQLVAACMGFVEASWDIDDLRHIEWEGFTWRTRGGKYLANAYDGAGRLVIGQAGIEWAEEAAARKSMKFLRSLDVRLKVPSASGWPATGDSLLSLPGLLVDIPADAKMEIARIDRGWRLTQEDC
jgi:hypothetical protein